MKPGTKLTTETRRWVGKSTFGCRSLPYLILSFMENWFLFLYRFVGQSCFPTGHKVDLRIVVQNGVSKWTTRTFSESPLTNLQIASERLGKRLQEGSTHSWRFKMDHQNLFRKPIDKSANSERLGKRLQEGSTHSWRFKMDHQNLFRKPIDKSANSERLGKRLQEGSTHSWRFKMDHQNLFRKPIDKSANSK